MLEKNYKKSGHHSTGQELDNEIYNNWIYPRNYTPPEDDSLDDDDKKDLSLFYCWLTWKDHLDTCGWLSRFEKSGGNTPDSQEIRKVKAFDPELKHIMKEQVAAMKMSSEMENEYFKSEIEKDKRIKTLERMQVLEEITNSEEFRIQKRQKARKALNKLKLELAGLSSDDDDDEHNVEYSDYAQV